MTTETIEVKKTPITRHFDTGAVRGSDTGRGKPSLMPFEAMSMVSRCFNGPAFFPMDGFIQVSRIYEAGAQKYEDRNWEKGIPLSAFVDSAMRHFAKFQTGMTDEPHCGQFAWNICCLLQTYIWVGDGHLNESLFDLPRADPNVCHLRESPLPSIDVLNPTAFHASRAVGSLWGFCYGKHPINLATAAAHALCLVDVYTKIKEGRLGADFNDMSWVMTSPW